MGTTLHLHRNLLGHVNLLLEKGEDDSSEEDAPSRRHTAKHCAGCPAYDALDSAASFVVVAVLPVCTQSTVLWYSDVLVASCFFIAELDV